MTWKPKFLRVLIDKELKLFRALSLDAQKLLWINLVYSLAFPFIILFSSAFIFSQSSEATWVIYYQYGWFSGLTVSYLINGILLRKVSIKWLFGGGIILSVLSVVGIIFFSRIGGVNVFFCGSLVGIGSGFYWANRNFLSVLTTDDTNRVFFTSIEQVIGVIGNVLSPLILGFFFWLGKKTNTYGEEAVYKIASIVIFLMVVISIKIIKDSSFQSPQISHFTYWKFSSFWQKQRLLTFLIGAIDAGFMIVPLLLIFSLVGDEDSLGFLESLSAILSAIIVYQIGKNAKPSHRMHIMLAGVVCAIMGGLSIGISFSLVGVLLVKFFQTIANVFIFTASRSTLFTSIEKASAHEKRDNYTYIMDNEYFVNSGRFFGGLVYLLLNLNFGEDIALRFSLLVLSIFIIGTIPLVRYLERSNKIEITGGVVY